MFVRLEVLNTFWTWYFQFTVGLWCKPCDKLRRICRVLDGWPVQFLLRKGKHAFFNGESPVWPKDFCQYVRNTYWQKSLGHVNVWQKPLQYCKVISLQLIKINEKKKNQTKQTNKQKTCLLFQIFSQYFFLLLLPHLWQRLLVSSMSLSFYFFLCLLCVQCSTLPSPQNT